jgi:SSS family solute:Na+ symporter
VVTVVGAVISILITIAINSIQGLNLFNIFQSVLGFIAPPMSAVFLFGIFWKRTTKKAANAALTIGTLFSIGIGVLYLWVFPADQYPVWPHFMMLSFLIFVCICVGMVVISLLDRNPQGNAMNIEKITERTSATVIAAWTVLAVVMVALYIVFNGH